MSVYKCCICDFICCICDCICFNSILLFSCHLRWPAAWRTALPNKYQACCKDLRCLVTSSWLIVLSTCTCCRGKEDGNNVGRYEQLENQKKQDL
jgi:hypothetical protein